VAKKKKLFEYKLRYFQNQLRFSNFKDYSSLYFYCSTNLILLNNSMKKLCNMKKTFDISNTSNSIKAKKNPILLILVIMIKINK